MKIDLKKKIQELRKDSKKTKRTSKISTEELKDLLVELLDENKAEDIVTIDLAGKSEMADYMIVATGRVNRHLAAMADHVTDKLHEHGYRNILPEGTELCEWVLIDGYDIIIHLFRPEIRELYNLEKMWKLELPGESK
jgi:ribosome-associated protein